MLKPAWLDLLAKIGRIGDDPYDPDDVRLQKRILVAIALITTIAGILWGGMYLLLGQPAAGMIPIAYAPLTLANLAVFHTTRRYPLFRFCQLLLLLLLPFLLMMALGGFVNGSAVMLWALVTPLGALLVTAPRLAIRWFVAYLVLIPAVGLNLIPWTTLLACLSLPIAWQATQVVLTQKGRPLNAALAKTGQTALVFSLLFWVGLLFS